MWPNHAQRDQWATIGGSVPPREGRGFESVDFGASALEEEEALDTEQSKERARKQDSIHTLLREFIV